MKNKISLIMLSFFVLTIISCTMFLNNVSASDTKDITFTDKVLYENIKKQFDDRLISYTNNDNTNTITMTNDEINNVKYLTISSKFSSLDGIENFTNLEELSLLYDGDWEDNIDISKIGSLVKLYRLRIANFAVRDITPLESLVNLRDLELTSSRSVWAPISQYGFTSLMPLKDKVGLTSLYLKGYHIQDVELLENFQNLKTLALLGCNIDNEDLKHISKLTTLTTLRLGSWNYEGNNISDISLLSNLENLETLYLCNNDISDISTLSSLVKLKNLYLDQNNITDLSPLSNLPQLRILSTGRDCYGKGNPIKDLTPLANIKSLVELHLSRGQIEDITPLNNLPNLRELDLSGNKITVSLQSTQKEYELPNIFFMDGIERLECENCTISEDGKTVILPDDLDNKDAKVKIIMDTLISKTAYNTTLTITRPTDLTDLNVTVGYDITELTNKDVNVTLTSNKNLKPIDGWNLSNDKKVLTKTFDKNENFVLDVYDEEGKAVKVNISINNIDKDPPVVESTVNKNSDGTVQVILKANEKIREVDGWIFSEDKMTLSKIYSESQEEEIKIYDIAGNETIMVIKAIIKNEEVTESMPENNDIPQTGDSVVYVGALLVVATAVLYSSMVYIKKKRND